MTSIVISDKETAGSDLWLHDDVLNDDVDVNLVKRDGTKLVLKGSATSGWYSPPKGTHSGDKHREVGSGRAIISRKPVPKRGLGSSPTKRTDEISASLKGANQATIVTYEDGTKAIFKSSAGMDMGDVGSEVLAYEFSESIGWHLVPETTVTRIGGKFGSMQRWVPNSSDGINIHASIPHSEFVKLLHGREYTRMAVMDRLISNPDRHDGNFVVDKAGRMWAIDNGMAFSPSGSIEAHKRWIQKKIPSRTGLAAIKQYSDKQKQHYAAAYMDVAKWSQTSAYRDYVDSLRSTIGAGAAIRLEYTVGVCRDRYGG